MRVKQWIKLEDEVEIDVDIEQVMNELPGTFRDESLHHIRHMISRCYSCLKAVPDSMIEQMSPTARKMIADSLRKEADRYVSK